MQKKEKKQEESPWSIEIDSDARQTFFDAQSKATQQVIKEKRRGKPAAD
jgi:hypothetical protein